MINKVMFIKDIIGQRNEQDLDPIQERCMRFIELSEGQPLLKNLPVSYDDVCRVKIRQKKPRKVFEHTLNGAFQQEHALLAQRSIFSNGESTFIAESAGVEPFFIFPTNGFKFMYSREVENSSADYKIVFEKVFEEFGEDEGEKILTDILRFSYTNKHLAEGIRSGAEVIIYNIPYYYAVRVGATNSYSDLLNALV